MSEEPRKYELRVSRGSGWNGANWLVVLGLPTPNDFLVLRHFETEKEARDEAAKIVVELVQSSNERR